MKTSSISTRDRILQISRDVFNENGFGTPTLYTLSQRIGISRGNLTYYFAQKEDLLSALVEEMDKENKSLYLNALRVPSWKSLSEATEGLHRLQRRFAFIFFDGNLLKHPEVKEHIVKYREDNIRNQLNMIQLSIQIGNMKDEEVPGTYYNISQTYWMVSFYWQITNDISDLENEPGWDKIMWSLLLPHFTKKGIDSFKTYFGKSYFEHLGQSFEKCVSANATF